MITNLKTRTISLQPLQVRMVEKLKYLEIPPLPAMDLASVLTFWKFPNTSLGKHDL